MESRRKEIIANENKVAITIDTIFSLDRELKTQKKITNSRSHVEFSFYFIDQLHSINPESPPLHYVDETPTHMFFFLSFFFLSSFISSLSSPVVIIYLMETIRLLLRHFKENKNIQYTYFANALHHWSMYTL